MSKHLPFFKGVGGFVTFDFINKADRSHTFVYVHYKYKNDNCGPRTPNSINIISALFLGSFP